MKLALLTAGMFFLGSSVAAAGTSKEDLLKLARAGMSDDVMVAYLTANGPVDKLSPEDMAELKAAGVGDRVLSAAPSTPVPSRVEVVERPVYEPPRTVYVETVPGYYPPVVTYRVYRPCPPPRVGISFGFSSSRGRHR